MITTAEYSSAVSDGPNRSGVSWAAIFAGAAAAAALSLILVILGAGLGFAATSPWAHEGASAKALGISTIIWLLVTQILASGLGGYVAGRLRVKWANLHGDEVYFRDTAHGFLSWAVATLVAAMLIAGTLGNVVGAGAQAGASVVSGAASGAGMAAAGAAADSKGSSDPMGYFVDTLFRADGPASVSEDAANGVASRILAKTLAGDGTLTAEDGTYLAQLVAQRTRLTQAEAEARVDQVYAQARQAAEDAKLAAQKAADAAASAAAWTAIWTFIALLCGAFFASLAALFGGRQRDQARWLDNDDAARRANYAGTTPVR
ncbi:MAG TPA: hypothetical protein VJS90_11855 [Pseudomonas sp.]|uniref:hypothetical protein n=1 Tax=Pseudomonas sp. TaxID=306 RepID=UPI002B4866E0|nr:hypothetical protein [Pseudomonas sp.]HKS13719.1 hypothetical protein [Pseudomonas sp.]